MSKTKVVPFSVEFGGVGLGKTTARIGAKFQRSVMSLDQADNHLCERRLIGQIRLENPNDGPGQGKLVETDLVVDGAFDVKGYSVKTDTIGTGFTFQLNEITVNDLAKFKYGRGQLVIRDVKEIPAGTADEHEQQAA